MKSAQLEESVWKPYLDLSRMTLGYNTDQLMLQVVKADQDLCAMKYSADQKLSDAYRGHFESDRETLDTEELAKNFCRDSELEPKTQKLAEKKK
jgi:hypothetical protein